MSIYSNNQKTYIQTDFTVVKTLIADEIQAPALAVDAVATTSVEFNESGVNTNVSIDSNGNLTVDNVILATQPYVDAAIANLVDSSPEALDTLNELAAALGDDPNFATTVTNNIATKLAISDFGTTFDTRLATKTTDDLTEGTNLYYTVPRARGSVSASGSISYNSLTGVFSYTTPTTIASLSNHTTDDLTEGTNLYFTQARARGSVSASGDLSYDNATGLFSYTTPTTIASLSNHTTDDLTEGTNLYYTDERVDDRVDALIVAGTGVQKNYDDAGNLLTVSLDFSEFDTDSIIEGATNTFLASRTTDDISEGDTNLYFTQARARGSVSAVDAGGDGSFSYNPITGAFTYIGPDASEVRAHFTAGTGISYDNSTGVISASSVTNDSLVNSSVTINGLEIALGGSGTLVTDDISEDVSSTNLWYTDSRARSAVSASGSLSYNNITGVFNYTTPSTDGVTEGATNLYFTTARARNSFSGGTGITITDGIVATTITQYTDAMARSSISVSGAATYNSTTGVINVTGGVTSVNTQTGDVVLSTDNISEGTGNLYFTQSRVRGSVGASGDLSYDNATGVFSYTTPTTIASISNHSTDDLTEGDTSLYFTQARARGSVSAVDAGGDGSFSYNPITGAFTYIGPDASEVRAHFTAGTGINVVDGEISTTITQYTDAMARSAVSVSGDLAYNSLTGVFSYTTPTTIASISNHSTDDLAEGATNLYYTDARWNAKLSAADTDDLAEGATNLYYTDARSRSSISVSGSLSYNNSTGVISYTQPTVLSAFTNDTNYITAADSITGNSATATALATARTISLDGDVSGSASFDGSANITITAAVANDSHTHDFSNITGKPTTLSGYGITDGATATYVDDAISGLLGGAGAAYDTLQELKTLLDQGDATLQTAIDNLTIGDGTITVSAGSGMSGGGSFTTNQTNNSTITIAHADTSSVASTNNSTGTSFVKDLEFDTYGHVTSVVSSLASVTDTTYDAGDGLALVGTTFSHADTSSVSSINNSGNTFIQDLSFDTYGHVIGVTSATATDTNTTYSAGNGISLSGTTFGVAAGGGLVQESSGLAHADTSSVSNVNNSGNTFIQDLSFDGYGHVTAVASGTASFTDTNTTDWRVANSAGTEQFAVSAAEQVRFAGSGATSVSFDSATQTITISSTDTNTNTTYSAGNGISLSGTTFGVAAGGGLVQESSGLAHADTSSVTSANNSGNTFIQDLTFDGYGHVTGVTSATATDTNTTDWRVANSAGTEQFAVSAAEQVRFAGSGATSVSFNSSTQTVTISSTDTNTTYSAGSGIDLSGTTFSHTDTSSVSNVNNSGNTFIQDLTFDGYGHVTAVASGTASFTDTNTTSLPIEDSAGTVQFTATDATGLQFVGSGATSVAFDSTNKRVTFSSTDTNTTYSAGSGISLSGTTFSHADTSSVTSADNSGNTFIQDLGFDTYGHVTSVYSASWSNAVSITGNADTATKWATARTITLGGNISGSVSIDGSSNVTLTGTVSYSTNAGNASNISTIATSTNASHYLTFVNSNNTGATYEQLYTDAGIYYNPSTNYLYITGEITAYASDAKLKTNVETISEPLAKLQAIRGVSYEWNEEGQRLGLGTDKHIGVIAQEVEAVMPELVVESAHEGYKTVKYDKLTALLIESVKAQQKQIEQLQAEIASLKDSKGV